MKLVKISIFKCNTPFKINFASPHTTRTQADSIIVELCFDNGIAGYGESAPRPYVTHESCATVIETISHRFSPILLGMDIQSMEDIANSLNLLENKCLTESNAAYNSALGAIDIALLDAFGKMMKVPLHTLLGPILRNEAPSSLSIPMLSLSTIEGLYDRLKPLDFKSVKVVLGRVESDNIERVHMIRSLFGKDMDLRVEANGKWTPAYAISTIEKLRQFNISAVEQPVGASDFAGLKKVRTVTGVPVIADESILNLSHAEKLIEMEACDIINIKISKCGGLLRSKMIADVAKSHNLRCLVGAHVGETDILEKAGECFALTTSDIICFEGFSQLLFESSWEKYAGGKNHGADRLAGYGLGVEPDKTQLEAVCSLVDSSHRP